MNDYKQGKPFYAQHSYRRDDVYIATGNTNRLFAAGPDDNTPLYRHWEPGKYNPNCSCCWLGFGHTEASHAQHLQEAHD